MIQGGPFHDLDAHVSDDLIGLALLDLESLDEARELIDTDPVVQTGVYGYRVYSWGGPPLRR